MFNVWHREFKEVRGWWEVSGEIRRYEIDIKLFPAPKFLRVQKSHPQWAIVTGRRKKGVYQPTQD